MREKFVVRRLVRKEISSYVVVADTILRDIGISKEQIIASVNMRRRGRRVLTCVEIRWKLYAGAMLGKYYFYAAARALRKIILRQ